MSSYFFIQYLIISWGYPCHPFAPMFYHCDIFPRVSLSPAVSRTILPYSLSHHPIILMLFVSSIHYSVLALCYFSSCLIVSFIKVADPPFLLLQNQKQYPETKTISPKALILFWAEKRLIVNLNFSSGERVTFLVHRRWIHFTLTCERLEVWKVITTHDIVPSP